MRTILFIWALFCGYQSIAQLSKTSLPVSKSTYTIKGDYYSQYKNYVLAVNTYNKAIQWNPKEVHAMLGMADAYHMLGKDDLASQWYKKAFATNPDVDVEYILKYINIVSASRNSSELRHWVDVYNSRVMKSGEHMDSVIFVAENLTSINSKNSDSAPLIYDSKIIFSSDRATAGNFNTYESALNSEGIFEGVRTLNAATNSGRVEGGFSIARRTNTLYFTGTEKGSTTTPPAMEIFYSAIPTDPSTQLKVNRLSFKNFDHSLGHPAISSDGTMLYFAAHSPKHTRGFDLYHSQFNGKKWSPPVALGTTINSHGDELYPMLVNDSTLYFASNGHGGLGGFDIFKVNLKQAHRHPPVHLQPPINSTANEFGFVMNNTSDEYYLSSNRFGGLGGNDIYRIYKLPFKKKKHNVAKSEELFIYTSKGDQIKLSGSNKENLKFDFQPGQKYNLTVEYDNYRTGATRTTKGTTSFTKLNFYTFDIQKSTETVYDQKSKTKQVQDIHINPGDLVTFQLIPNMVQDPDADVTKIQFQRLEAVIADGQTIVFSYVAEGGPSIPLDDALPVADLTKLDTTSSKQPAVAEATAGKSSQATATTIEPTVASTQATAVKSPAEKTIQTTPTSSELTVATTTQKAPTPETTESNKSVNSSASSAQSSSVTAKEVVPVAVAGTLIEAQKEKTQTEQATGGSVVSTPIASNETIVAAKTEQKNPILKTASDTVSSKPPVTTKEIVTATVPEAQRVNKAASTELATTEAPTNKNTATQSTTPLVSNTAHTGVSNTTDIQFRVQIAASKSTLSDDQLKKIYNGKNEIRSFNEDGFQKYYIEQTPSFSTAKRTLNESGVPQAFIAAYQGDKKLNLQEAIALQKKNKNSPPTNEPEIKNPTIEQLSATSTQPQQEKQSSITTDVSKEVKTTITPTSNIPTSDAKAKEPVVENKAPGADAITNVPMVATQPTKEVQQEKSVPVQAESSKEKQVVDVTQPSQSAPTKTSSTDVTEQSVATESKSDKSEESVATQPSNSSVVTSENIVANSTEPTKEEQIAVTSPVNNEASTKTITPNVKTSDNTTAKKPSHDIAHRDDFSYRLQIAASETPLSNSYLKKIYQGDKEVHSFKEDEKYKYYLLETSNYFAARQTLNEVNVNHAFISAYKKDTKVPLEQAINDQYKLPEAKKDLNATDSVVRVTTVNFEFDKFELQNDQIERLRSIAISELMKNPSFHVIVNGYTDIRGSETYNFGLSQERALFVARQIVAEGIDAQRVATHYFGESQLAKYCPEHQNCDESIHQANRRVEILLLVNKTIR